MGIPIGKYWLLGGSRACIFREIERARPAGSDLPLIILIVPAHLPTFWNWRVCPSELPSYRTHNGHPEIFGHNREQPYNRIQREREHF
jgi:hypothetical protein